MSISSLYLFSQHVPMSLLLSIFQSLSVGELHSKHWLASILVFFTRVAPAKVAPLHILHPSAHSHVVSIVAVSLLAMASRHPVN